jgi:Mor family transcriptional regulator
MNFLGTKIGKILKKYELTFIGIYGIINSKFVEICSAYEEVNFDEIYRNCKES